MQHLKFSLLILLTLSIVSCSSELELQPTPTPPLSAEKAIADADQEMEDAKKELADFSQDWLATRSTVTVPAGSVDALADAIEAAGPGGTVILASGEHTENEPVIIERRIQIVGEGDASLVFPNAPAPAGIPMEMIAALHIRNVSQVWLKNFSVSTGSSSRSRLGVLIQNASRTRIEGLTITDFQCGIILDGGNRCQLIRNTVVGIYDEVSDGLNWGITNSTGQRTIIMRNEVSNFAVGIFLSDRRSLAFSNTLIGGDIGILWCTVPEWLYYEDGTFTSAAESANGCRGYSNTAIGNLWSYLVIDGAKSSVLIQNESIEPALYDIELANETERFGFLTPTSANSLVISTGSYIDYSIKDCTGDNMIIGGSLVNTELDPCF